MSFAMLSLLTLIAQMPQRQSYLGWMFRSLGWFYTLVLPGSALLVFIGAVLVVAICRRPSVIAAYLVFLPLPIMIGAFGTVQGLIASYSVIANSTMAPMQSELAQGYSTGLFTLLVGILLTFPSYFVISIGLFLRTIFWQGGDTRPQSSQT